MWAKHDWRIFPISAAAWMGALCGIQNWLQILAITLVLATPLLFWKARQWWVLSILVVAAVAALLGQIQYRSVQTNPVHQLANTKKVVRIQAQISSDPTISESQFGQLAKTTLKLQQVSYQKQEWHISGNAIALSSDMEDWLQLPVGSQISFTGTLNPAKDGQNVVALIRTRSQPETIADPPIWLKAVNHIRHSLQNACQHLPKPAAGLVPALTDGDTSAIAAETKNVFSTAAMTHLLAVSGSNLTLLLGCGSVLLRTIGVRGSILRAAACLIAVSFVLLCRAEPSVVRSAVMGLVTVFSLSAANRDGQGVRAIAVAVLLLILYQPQLSQSWGFLLSVLASAGIIILAKRWIDLMTWCPRWLAEMVAVPLAAQVATQPAVTVLSQQVSLVGLLANIVAAPLVAPATIGGLIVAALSLIYLPLAQLVAWIPGICAHLMVLVANLCASLPGAAWTWPVTWWAIFLLILACLLSIPFWEWILGKRGRVGIAALIWIAILCTPPWQPGWPPKNWLIATCDVGQGDATVFNAGAHSAVVVDTGPEPELIRTCLTGLGIKNIPVLVITHDHADHSQGISGLQGIPVGQVWLSSVAGENRPQILQQLHQLGAPVQILSTPQHLRAGNLQLQLHSAALENNLEDSAFSVAVDGKAWDGVQPGLTADENDASVLVLVQSEKLRTLVTGDIGAYAQSQLLKYSNFLQCDVLKVPHHGSKDQDPNFLAATGARVALIGVGAKNSYGHPAKQTLQTLQNLGMNVLRTDYHSNFAVSFDGQQISAFAQKTV